MNERAKAALAVLQEELEQPANVFAKAAKVLEANAWIDDQSSGLWSDAAFDPEARTAWDRCVDAVNALPEDDHPMSVVCRLKSIFSGTVCEPCEPCGHIEGRVIWRWLNAPATPWVSRKDIEALKRRGQNSGSVTDGGAVHLHSDEKDPWSRPYKKRDWQEFAASPKLTDATWNKLRLENKDRVNCTGKGGRGPWQLKRSLCEQYGIACPDFRKTN